MVSERQGEIRKEYGYDKRGNLTAILENGAWKKRYVYGAMNRLEEAVDAAGKQARYQYNGLGHRVGKQEGVLPKEKLEKLDPQRRVGMEIGNSRQITYTLDLTRQYYNLLERTEESQSQRYFGMGTWQRMRRMGKGTITFRMSWEVRFGLRTVPEQSKRAMDMEPLGKTCTRTRGRCSRLAIRDTKEMR